MTVKQLFIELLKLIIRGKGNYYIYVMFHGWVGGVFSPNDDDEQMERVVLW